VINFYAETVLSYTCFIIAILKPYLLHVKAYLLYFIRIKEKHHVSGTWQPNDLQYLPTFFLQSSLEVWVSYIFQVTLNFKINHLFV